MSSPESLPLANVQKILKKFLPPEVKISHSALEAFRDSLDEFISFISAEAAEKCAADQRKTMKAEDILSAMNSLGIERYNKILKAFIKGVKKSMENEQDLKDETEENIEIVDDKKCDKSTEE